MRWHKPSASTVFVFLMVLSFLGLFLPVSWFGPFRATVNSLIAPPAAGSSYLLHYLLGRPPSLSPEDSTNILQLHKQIADLQAQCRFLHSQLMLMTDRYAKAERLRKTLLLYNYSLISANVYGYGLPGQAVLSIDQGSAAGLKNGLWVVGFTRGASDLTGRALLESSALLGEIAEVQARTAQVRLLGDLGQRPISARLYRFTPGTTEFQTVGRGSDLHVTPFTSGRLVAKEVPNQDLAPGPGLTAEIVGCYVVTNPINRLPGGLTIGQVVKVRPSPKNMLFSDLIIEPVARTAHLSSVMVLRPNDD